MGLTGLPSKKTYAAAYILWLIGGPLGLHRLYLHRHRSGSVMMLLSIVSIFAFAGMTLEIVAPGLDIATAVESIRARDMVREILNALTKGEFSQAAKNWFFVGFGAFGIAFLWAVLDALFIPSMLRSFTN